jgi:hypothetical protein
LLVRLRAIEQDKKEGGNSRGYGLAGLVVKGGISLILLLLAEKGKRLVIKKREKVFFFSSFPKRFFNRSLNPRAESKAPFHLF